MTFPSVLFRTPEDNAITEATSAPDFFADLNLDQVVDAIVAKKQAYQLKPFFYTSLHDIDAIHYRQEVAQDLEDVALLEHIKAFADKMTLVRRYFGLIAELTYKYHKAGWFLEAADVYCDAVVGLLRDLGQADLTSRGLLAFREYLTAYASGSHFTTLLADTQQLKAALATVKYCINIKGLRVKVRKYEAEFLLSADRRRRQKHPQCGWV